MWNLKYYTNEFIQEAKTDLWTQITDLWLLRSVREGWIESLGLADAN